MANPAANEPPGGPLNRWKPEFLGAIYSLNRNIPPYMPQSDEPALMDWLQNYINVASVIAPQFQAVYGNPAKFPFGATLEVYNNFLKARADAEASRDYAHSANACKNILAYATDHTVVVPAQPPLKPSGVLASRAGLIGMIDWQVKTLREQPGFTQILADRLGIIPKAPAPAPDTSKLDPKPRAKVDGNKVILTVRSVAGVKGANGVEIRVDRGDGHLHLLTTTGGSRYIDVHVMPENPTAWTYLTNYVDESGIAIGVQSSVTVIVQAIRT